MKSVVYWETAANNEKQASEYDYRIWLLVTIYASYCYSDAFSLAQGHQRLQTDIVLLRANFLIANYCTTILKQLSSNPT